MIRKLTLADREEYVRLVDEFYHSEGVLHPIPLSHAERTFDEMMQSDIYAEGFLLYADGDRTTPAGYALIAKTWSQEGGGLCLWLDELYVRSEYRSKGLGRELFAYLEKNRPAARYRLEIEPTNARALRLYERLGYENLSYVQYVKEGL